MLAKKTMLKIPEEIRLKWLLKVKYHLNEPVARFKVRLIAQDFLKIQNISFVETFALTVKRKLL